jgi:hypothetical protein
MSVSLSADGESLAPLASSFWRMKASIGFPIFGGVTAFGGRNDQNRRSLAVTSGSAAVPATSGSGGASGAPCAIQLASLSISVGLMGFTPALSRPAFGGIAPARSFLMARLSSGLVSVIAGPDLPPFKSDALLRISSPASRFWAPWQELQCRRSSGMTSCWVT